MTKLFMIATLGLSTVLYSPPQASAQTAMFTYSGVPTAPLRPGDSFTLSLDLVFTAGGNITNIGGYDLWIRQVSPATHFPFRITNRDASGSLFGEPLADLTFPQIVDPINRNTDGSISHTDLGALTPEPNTTLSSGVYFAMTLTFVVSPIAADGTYTFGNTTAATLGVGGRISVVTNQLGTTFPIADSRFSVTVVPEPATTLLLVIGASALTRSLSRGRRRS